MTDHADLIRRLNEAAKSEAKEAERWRKGAPTIAAHFDNRAALLREAAKALGRGVMGDFHDTIAGLCSKEIARAGKENDDDRAANVIAVLATMLGRTAAIVAKGDGATIEKLLIGAEQLAAEEATDFSRLFTLAAKIKRGYTP